MRILRTVLWAGGLALAACQSPPPVVYDSFQASTDLYRVSPADVAVMPIEDATADHAAGQVLESIRAEIAADLVQRMYTPLAVAKVDEVLRLQPGAAPSSSVVDASWLQSVAGKFGEDAVLAVRITLWDETSLMMNGHVHFSADVSLSSPKSPNPLWSGAIKGDVKAGGRGPAPRDRAGRQQSAAAEFARELVRRLPSRRP